LIRITAYSADGSYTVAVVPIYLYNTANVGIDNIATYKMIPEKEFLVRNTSRGFMVYSPFASDSRIVVSDLSGRQVALKETVKGRSWNNISTSNKLSNSVYFIQTADKEGNNSFVKKTMIAK
jgi:hypothetical protein